MSQFGKKSAKVYHCLYSSTEQLHVALWTYMLLNLGLNNDKCIYTLPLQKIHKIYPTWAAHVKDFFSFHRTAEAMRSPAPRPAHRSFADPSGNILASKVYTGATIRTNFFRFFFSLVFGSFSFVILFFSYLLFNFFLILLFLFFS